ncbi:MAG: hypothetical protein R2860_13080 [Desulfobacterales bacterium]
MCQALDWSFEAKDAQALIGGGLPEMMPEKIDALAFHGKPIRPSGSGSLPKYSGCRMRNPLFCMVFLLMTRDCPVSAGAARAGV